MADKLEEIKRLTKTFPDYDGNPKYTPHTDFFGPALLTWLILELEQAREKHVRDYVFMESQTRQLLEAEAKIQELEAELLATRRQREEGLNNLKSLAIQMEDNFNGEDMIWKEKAQWLRDCIHQLLEEEK